MNVKQKHQPAEVRMERDLIGESDASSVGSKKLVLARVAQGSHWVGDGFPVQSLFAYHEPVAKDVSPFLLFDYAAPRSFRPTADRRGVGEHPHRGFETVTIVYAGEVEHRDSSGGSGKIGVGDVQWMTAGSGVVHEEFHGTEFSRQGGLLSMAQLWVNLPAEHKMTKPRYQEILAANIPTVQITEKTRGRVIAGALQDVRGPAQTFTSLNVWDLRTADADHWTLDFVPGHTATLAVLEGEVTVANHRLGPAGLFVLGRDGSSIAIQTSAEAKLLVLSGAPIDEPIVGHGPFVMNTQGEIRQAMLDYQSGRMGHLT